MAGKSLRWAFALSSVVVACATAAGSDDDGGSADSQPGFDSTKPETSTLDNYVPPQDASKPDTSVFDAGLDAPKEAAASCLSCPLRLQYLCADTVVNDNQIKPHIQIINEGDAAQAMSELTVRYWYTIDAVKPQSFYCDYAVVGCGNLTGTFVAMEAGKPEAGADYYVEVSFSSGAGSIAPDASSGEVQERFNHTDYSTINQANDYSFDSTKTSFTDWDHVTLYKNGVLVWGTEP
jgi:hypothetical protein